MKNKQTPLKLEELKEGQIYKCLLSGKKVLITNEDFETNILSYKTSSVIGLYYSDKLGYKTLHVSENQLTLDEEENNNIDNILKQMKEKGVIQYEELIQLSIAIDCDLNVFRQPNFNPTPDK